MEVNPSCAEMLLTARPYRLFAKLSGAVVSQSSCLSCFDRAAYKSTVSPSYLLSVVVVMCDCQFFGTTSQSLSKWRACRQCTARYEAEYWESICVTRYIETERAANRAKQTTAFKSETATINLKCTTADYAHVIGGIQFFEKDSSAVGMRFV